MTVAALSRIPEPRFGAREAGLWTSAAAIILAAHVAVAYAVQNLSFDDMQDGGPPPALAVEMAPMVIAPAVPEEAAMLDTVTPEPPDAAEETDKPVDVKPVTDPSPAVEPAEPVTERPLDSDDTPEAEQAAPAEQSIAALSEQKPLDEVVPDPVEAIAPDVVIPLPQPKPVEAEVKAQKPVETRKKAEKKPVEKPKERVKKEKAPPPRATTTASIDAKAAAKAAAPQSSATQRGSGNSKQWDAKLRAWLNRHKRYPSAAKARRAEGNVLVTFTVDASGRVLSARLARSSGDADLDRTALSILQGATVPAPPPELGSRPSRTAPFAFSVRD